MRPSEGARCAPVGLVAIVALGGARLVVPQRRTAVSQTAMGRLGDHTRARRALGLVYLPLVARERLRERVPVFAPWRARFSVRQRVAAVAARGVRRDVEVSTRLFLAPGSRQSAVVARRNVDRFVPRFLARGRTRHPVLQEERAIARSLLVDDTARRLALGHGELAIDARRLARHGKAGFALGKARLATRESVWT